MPDKLLSGKFAEELIVERADIALMRQHSLEVGIDPITPAMGAQIAVIAAATRPTNIIEIGTGLGRRNGAEGILRYVEARTVAEATGLITLPRTGPEWGRLTGTMLVLLRALKVLRRR